MIAFFFFVNCVSGFFFHCVCSILREDSESRRGSEAQYSRMGIRRETVEMRLKNASQKSAAASQ